MKNFIEIASAHIRLEEGTPVIEHFLLECYMNPGISTKELARATLLPVPIAAAIKKELIKAGALTQANGVHCTVDGKAWMEKEWGFSGIDKYLYKELMVNGAEIHSELADILIVLRDIMSHRPQVNVQIDQSKCTAETSLRRAILCLKQHSLVGKKILCVGDDDLVSVSIGLLLQRLFPNRKHYRTAIHVADLDERFLHYIREIAEREKLPIQCHHHDLRQPLLAHMHGQYDCFFTDPPYTLQGMTLFVSRGISALKKRNGLPIFLSFAHKSPAFTLAMQREFIRMGLTTGMTIPRFNEYEGAEMIANRSQMIILKTTDQTTPECTDVFVDALYTGEVKRTLRIYRCKQCGKKVEVGVQGDVTTIEQLKNQGCHSCKNDTFEMLERS